MSDDRENKNDRAKDEQMREPVGEALNAPAEPPWEPLPAAGDAPGAGQNKPAAALRRRHIWKRLRWVIWILLMVPVVYFVVQLILIMAPRQRLETALPATMVDSMDVTGQVVLTSTPIIGGGGILYYTVPTGQRVSAENVVAYVYNDVQSAEARDTLDALDEELQLLLDAKNTVAAGGDLEILLGQMQTGLYSLLGAVENGNYTALDSARNEIALAGNKMQVATGQAVDFDTRIAELTSQKIIYEAAAAPAGEILAPETGYFVPSAKDDVMLRDYDVVAALSPAELQASFEQAPTYYGAQVAGHLVTDYKWHFFMVVTEKQAEKFVVGDKNLAIVFPEVSDKQMPVSVSNVVVDGENGIAAVELYCEYISPDILALRVEDAQIVFGEQKGIKVDKNALRLVDEESEEGGTITYKGVYVKFGNMVYFRKINILLEDEFHILVSDTLETGVNELRMYDQVIVDSGGVELYDGKILSGG